MADKGFRSGVIYRLREGVLFLPAIGYEKTIGSTNRFLVADPDRVKYFSYRHEKGYLWFRMDDSLADRIFGIHKSYADKIISEDDEEG